MAQATASEPKSGRTARGLAVPGLLRDVRVTRWVFQFAVVALVVLLIRWLWGNITTNSRENRIRTGWDFLSQRAGFPIPDNFDFSPNQPMRDAFAEGLLNTIRLASAGIVLATVLGVLLGIARLSSNFLVRSGARAYVEFVRNVPLLALLYLVYLGIVRSGFPIVEESWRIGSLGIFNNDGSSIVWFTGNDVLLVAIIAAAAAAAWLAARWRRTVFERTGEPARSGVFAAAAFAIVVASGWLIGGFAVSTPNIEGRRFVTGGITMSPAYFGALLALVAYTSSHIAEIVRGSIQAVPKGQGEAANALALSGFQRMRYVVLPQAMRIAIPPLGNQYLNLTKNTSLAAIFSYGELTKVTELGNSNSIPPVPSYLTILMIYLALSLIISLFVNIANWRLKLVER